MDSYGQVLINGAITVLSSAVVVIFLQGKLTQQVKDLIGWNKQQDERLDRHDDKIATHAADIAYFKGQKGMPQTVDR